MNRKFNLFLKIIFFGLLFIFNFNRIVFSVNNEPIADKSQLAGQYFFGDGTGVNNYLKLSQDRIFSFKWQGCLGTYDENEGTYSYEQGVLVLFPKRPNIREGFKGTPTHFFPISWGVRLYLIPQDQMLDFVNVINQGREPRKDKLGNFYLREGDEKKPVEGIPVLPSQWNDYLLQKPIEGKVIKVERRKVAIVNVGKKNGLKVGMLLTARDSRETRFTQLNVISVEDETAKAKTWYRDDKVRKDDIVSTKFYR